MAIVVAAVFIALTFQVNAVSAETKYAVTPKTEYAGNWWRGASSNERLIYVRGYFDGIVSSVLEMIMRLMEENGELDDNSEERKAVVTCIYKNIDTYYDYDQKGFNHVSLRDMVEVLDKVYGEEQYVKMPVAKAIDVWGVSITDRIKLDIEEMVEYCDKRPTV
jgi:hypothetical protein